MPSVRVVIPTFNRADEVCGALDTVWRQTYADFEVVVVDDGSSDDTVPRVEALAHGEPRLRLIRAPHGGVAAARSTGIDGPGDHRYVAFLDADDRWEPDHLRAAVDLLDGEPEVSLVFGAFETEDRTGTWRPAELENRRRRVRRPIELATRRSGPNGHVLHPERTLSWMIRGTFCPHTSTVVVRVSSAPPGRWFDADLIILEDVDFLLRLGLTGRPWAFLDSRQCTVRFLGDNLTRSTDLKSPVTLARQRAALRLCERKLRYSPRGDRQHVKLALASQAYLVGQCCAEQGQVRAACAAYFQSLSARPHVHVVASLLGVLIPDRVRRVIKSARVAVSRLFARE